MSIPAKRNPGPRSGEILQQTGGALSAGTTRSNTCGHQERSISSRHQESNNSGHKIGETGPRFGGLQAADHVQQHCTPACRTHPKPWPAGLISALPRGLKIHVASGLSHVSRVKLHFLGPHFSHKIHGDGDGVTWTPAPTLYANPVPHGVTEGRTTGHWVFRSTPRQAAASPGAGGTPPETPMGSSVPLPPPPPFPCAPPHPHLLGPPPPGGPHARPAPCQPHHHHCTAPRVAFRCVVVSLRGPGQSAVLPSARCVGALRSVVSLPRRPVVGVQGVVLVVAGVVLPSLLPSPPPRSGRPAHASPRVRVREA